MHLHSFICLASTQLLDFSVRTWLCCTYLDGLDTRSSISVTMTTAMITRLIPATSVTLQGDGRLGEKLRRDDE